MGRTAKNRRAASFGLLLLALGVGLIGTSHVYAATPLDAEIRFSSADYTTGEGDDATILLFRSGPPQGVAIVDYATTAGTATPGVDYQDASGRIFFLPTQTAAIFEVPTLGDAADEPDETINLSLTVTVLGVLEPPSTAVLTIEDDDSTAATVSVSNAAAAREIDGHAVFTLTLSPAVTGTVTVSYTTVSVSAVAGSDFNHVDGTVSFEPGITTQKAAVALIDDNVAEITETFKLKLQTATNGTTIAGSGEGIGTILDYTTILRRTAPVDTTYLRDLDVTGPAGGDYVVGSVSPSGNVTAPLSLTGAVPNEGCSALPAGSLTGKVVLVRRGTCTFNAKVLNIQNAGGVAVLIYNSSDGIFAGTLGSGVTVPVMLLTKSLGESLTTQLGEGPVTMQVLVP